MAQEKDTFSKMSRIQQIIIKTPKSSNIDTSFARVYITTKLSPNKLNCVN